MRDGTPVYFQGFTPECRKGNWPGEHGPDTVKNVHSRLGPIDHPHFFGEFRGITGRRVILLCGLTLTRKDVADRCDQQFTA